MSAKSSKLVQFQSLGHEPAEPSKERIMFSRSARRRKSLHAAAMTAAAIVSFLAGMYVLVDWSQVNDKLDFMMGKRVAPIHRK